MAFWKTKTDSLKTVPRATIDRRRSGARQAARRGRQEAASRRFGRFFYFLLWASFLGTLVYILCFSPFLIVEAVQVEAEGDAAVRDAVAAQAESLLDGRRYRVFPGRNLLLASPATLAAEIGRAFPETAEVRVERRFPHTLVVSFVPRAALLRWCSGGPCFLVDERGTVFAGDERLLPDSPLRVVTVVDESGEGLRLQGPAVDMALMRLALAIGPALHQDLGLETAGEYRVSAREADELKLPMSEGWTLLLDTRATAETVARHLRLFFERQVPAAERPNLEYVDLRIRDRVYYRMKGAADAVSVPEAAPQKPEPDKKKKQGD